MGHVDTIRQLSLRQSLVASHTHGHAGIIGGREDARRVEDAFAEFAFGGATMSKALSSRSTQPKRLWWRVALLLLPTGAGVGCDANPFDVTQQPQVVLTAGAGKSSTVIISWQPAGAQLVRVYKGATAGDGYTPDLMWSIAATSANSLTSAVIYGTASPAGGQTDTPAKPLVPGETYTVQVTRQDPKGSGDGFTNTKNRYIGSASFVLPVP